MKRNLTPYQKKQLSYAKDRRNIVAESRSIANKAIRKRKAGANRALRRAQAVNDLTAQQIEDIESFDDFVTRTKRRSWQKYPDISLKEYIEVKKSQKIKINKNNSL